MCLDIGYIDFTGKLSDYKSDIQKKLLLEIGLKKIENI